MSMTYRVISSHLTHRSSDRHVPATPAATVTPDPQPFGCAATMMCSPWEGLYLINELTSTSTNREVETGTPSNDLDHFLAALMYANKANCHSCG